MATQAPSIPFGPGDYALQRNESLASARAVAPLVVDILQPRSVLDMGCGSGAWLAAFQELGVERIDGVDPGHALDDQLFVPRERLQRRTLDRPIELEGRWDLAICLEVGEHLPATASRTLVNNIVTHADVALFSAAIPGQGGTHHINEQWPSYWNGLFEEVGFRCFDIIRPVVWQNESIGWWYRQNLLIFAASDAAAALEEAGYRSSVPNCVVHPFLLTRQMRPPRTRTALVQLGSAVAASLKHRVATRARATSSALTSQGSEVREP